MPLIPFEGVGDVIVIKTKQKLDEGIAEAVQAKFWKWIIVNFRASDETGAKHTLMPLFEKTVILKDIFGRIR